MELGYIQDYVHGRKCRTHSRTKLSPPNRIGSRRSYCESQIGEPVEGSQAVKEVGGVILTV